MLGKTTSIIVVVANALLVLAILAVMGYAPPSNAGFKDATSALAFVGGAAVAIERIIETGWTFLGAAFGSYWPLGAVQKQVGSLVTDLDRSLRPFHDRLKTQLDALAEKGQLSSDEASRGKQEIERLKSRFDDLAKLATDHQKVQLLAASASQNVSHLFGKYRGMVDDLERANAAASAAISGVQAFLVTFKDNPGRRVISMYAGAILGVGVAGVFGLDLFQAVLEPGPEGLPYRSLRVVLTGLVIGLGSNPTHEVIRAVQEYKRGQKAENAARNAMTLPPA
jgi:hypothetical protein